MEFFRRVVPGPVTVDLDESPFTRWRNVVVPLKDQVRLLIYSENLPYNFKTFCSSKRLPSTKKVIEKMKY